MTTPLCAQLRRVGDVDENDQPSIELLAADEIERLQGQSKAYEREIERLKVRIEGYADANVELRARLAALNAHETCEWREKAAAWLREKAAEQEKANREYPDHAAAYQSWRDRPGLFRMLADSVLREPNTLKASERQPCSHGNATGHCQHCLDAL